jgi:hypothetical protein
MGNGSAPKTLRLLYRVVFTFLRSYPAPAIFLLSFLLIVGLVVWDTSSEAYSEYKLNHLPPVSPAEHLRLAQDACLIKYGTVCADPAWATSHLNKIPREAAEYGEAQKLLQAIQLQQQTEQIAAEHRRQASAAQEAQRLKLTNQTQQESFDQMERNVAGSAHDEYTCATSTTGTPIVSFDNGHYWWNDDGRCAGEIEKRQAVEQRRQDEQRAKQQKQRDEDAQSSSYWPTTLRVETDMDSFWLNNEERTCQTFPDDKGKVARVRCSGNASHQDHSIPVKFWGGVDRNTVSDWKCRREGDEFVCRALD